jgi:hypothetical protein
MAEFREIADMLMRDGVTLDEIAEAFTPPVTANTVNRWKMEGHPLRPREGWHATLARILEDRAEHHKAQAITFHRLSRALSTGAGE